MPLWIKVAVVGFLCVLVPAYWHHYGPQNFLWFSDLALFMAAAALVLEEHRPVAGRWLASMAAVSVLLLEVAWNLDFFARLLFGVEVLGLADYMFESHRPLFIRLLSLFHVPMPPLLLWMVWRLGYEPRAWLTQTAVAWVVLPCSYWLGTPEQNINWTHGPGDGPQRWMPQVLYLALLMALFPLCVYLPTHLLLRRLFPPGRG